MTTHWTSRMHEEISGTRVVKYADFDLEEHELVDNSSPSQRRATRNRTGAVNVLEGTIARLRDSLIFESRIIDLDGTDQVRHTFDIAKCGSDDPMQGISQLTNEIRGW